MALTWDATTMSTGVADLDQQHRTLIGQLNQLFELMKEGKGGTKLDELLDFCGRYAATHFAHEEACMHRVQCPTAVANRSAHQEFTRTFADFRARLEREGPSTKLTLEVQQRMSEWLRNHIVRTDTALRGCVR